MFDSRFDEVTPKYPRILFDYGGVIAEEGFREGLYEIARTSGLDEKRFFDKCADIIYEGGYVIGTSSEGDYWRSVRKETGVNLSDDVMRRQILLRFKLREVMIALVRLLRRKGFWVGVLSDQTNWLAELNERDGFFKEFDAIFNSYDLGKGKRDITLFNEIAQRLEAPPENILFVDDNPGHVERARLAGLKTILFQETSEVVEQMQSMGLISSDDASDLKNTLQ